MKTLFVRNLPFDASEAALRQAFEVYGPVHRCSIAKNRETGESRGFGFVDMDDDPAAKAIAEMNGKMIGNRQVVVQESDPRGRTGSPAPGGPRPPMGGPRPPMGSGAGPRSASGGGHGGPRSPSGARPAPPGARNFGPPASPASERNRVYQEKKDRLKPYKRDHFDFRSALGEDEEDKRPRRGDDSDDGATE